MTKRETLGQRAERYYRNKYRQERSIADETFDAFKRSFLQEPQQVYGRMVICDTLRLIYRTNDWWSLARRCDKCNQFLYSVEFRGLAGLGAQLEEFICEKEHNCE